MPIAAFNRRMLLARVAAPVLLVRRAKAAPVTFKAAEVEEFLRTAKVRKTKSTRVGITAPTRAVMTRSNITHDAHIQTVDESKTMYQTSQGTEWNFRDSWRFNVAAYHLDQMLGLNMVPPSIERSYRGNSAAFTWWIAGAMMEVDRTKKKMEPPDVDRFNAQTHIVRVFDQLIFNTDRNLQNLLIDRDWNLWMIDHTRAFRMLKDLREPKNLVRCERRLLGALRALSGSPLQERTENYLTSPERDGLLARRDKIVTMYEDMIRERGEGDVLYDLPTRTAIYSIAR